MRYLPPALRLLPLHAGGGEEALPALLRLRSYLWFFRLFLRLLPQLAAADTLRHEGSYHALLRALRLFLSDLHHRIAAGYVHCLGICNERGEVVRLYLAIVDLLLHCFKVQFPAFIFLEVHAAGINAAVHLVGYLVALALHFRSNPAAGVFHLIQFKAGAPAGIRQGTVFLSVLAIPDVIPPAALTPCEPAAAFQQRVDLKVNHRFQPAGHINLLRGMLHSGARHIIAAKLLRQTGLHVGESVHRYLVGHCLIRADIRVIVRIIEVCQQIFYNVLGNIRIHKRRRGKPSDGKHLSYAQILQPAAKLPGGDAEHKVKVIPPGISLLHAGKLF